MGDCFCHRARSVHALKAWNFDEFVFWKMNFSKPWGVRVLGSGPPRRPCAFVVLSVMRWVFIDFSLAQFWDLCHWFSWPGTCFAMLCGAPWKKITKWQKNKTTLRSQMLRVGRELLWSFSQYANAFHYFKTPESTRAHRGNQFVRHATNAAPQGVRATKKKRGPFWDARLWII